MNTQGAGSGRRDLSNSVCQGEGALNLGRVTGETAREAGGLGQSLEIESREGSDKLCASKCDIFLSIC